MIHTGDAIEVMRTLPEASVDAVVTDPPYGLEFMGKAWDGPALWDGRARTEDASPGYVHPVKGKMGNIRNAPNYRAGHGYQQWCQAWGAEALRVTVPGGYLLAFGGTRTHHRLVCGLEDAGWIIRDELDWIFAQGFPKGKANLKPAHEPIVLARKPGPLRPLAIDACRIETTDKLGGGAEVRVAVEGKHEGWRRPWMDDPEAVDAHTARVRENVARAESLGRWPSNVLLQDAELFDVANPEVVGSGAVTTTGQLGPQHVERHGHWGEREPWSPTKDYGGDSGGYSRFFIIPKADRADREPVLRDAALLLHRERGECDKLPGWGNGDRKPSDRTASTSPARATSEATSTDGSDSDTSPPGKLPTDPSLTDTRSITSTATRPTIDSPTSSSLTPSPTSESTPAASSELGSGGSPAESAGNTSLWGPLTGTSPPKAGPSMGAAGRAISGSSSSRNRCAECGKPLPRVGVHPTTKPTDLMRHLIRLVTPSGGVVLDPFAGSGTTGIAAELEGFDYILIEQSAEYVAIAEARLNGVQKGLGLAG